ncbi:hypothetical protein [Paenibacillus sp. 1001270B_150601_E10]|uniref:hypothetical protein n=1 Tax=Paenibacillus sp. 1001270B_150601_E10 TaxID=2787079 RepID=UPI00189E056F|nr:hypothetical protein [Paenibacillus sp. 1001270B_150601_E10]
MHTSGMNMRPLSGKELEYIVDSISNEDLLLKQAAATAASQVHPEVNQLLTNFIQMHQQHIHTLTNAIAQHAQMAPTQPQQNQASQ